MEIDCLVNPLFLESSIVTGLVNSIHHHVFSVLLLFELVFLHSPLFYALNRLLFSEFHQLNYLVFLYFLKLKEIII